ncbi:hypothetical protein J6590_084749 [Homalodisca vitripennis]|nr:hypothetical protein J6590_084749 [Homalodisca vitripennis]
MATGTQWSCRNIVAYPSKVAYPTESPEHDRIRLKYKYQPLQSTKKQISAKTVWYSDEFDSRHKFLFPSPTEMWDQASIESCDCVAEIQTMRLIVASYPTLRAFP